MLQQVMATSDGSRLYFREYARATENEPVDRYTYVYHYQSADVQLIFRYDNTSHYPDIENAPHHNHLGEDKVVPSQAPDLSGVLQEIASLVSS